VIRPRLAAVAGAVVLFTAAGIVLCGALGDQFAASPPHQALGGTSSSGKTSAQTAST